MHKIDSSSLPLSPKTIVDIATNGEANLDDIKNFKFKDDFNNITVSVEVSIPLLLEHDIYSFSDYLSQLITDTNDLESIQFSPVGIIDDRIILSVNGDPSNYINNLLFANS